MTINYYVSFGFSDKTMLTPTGTDSGLFEISAATFGLIQTASFVQAGGPAAGKVSFGPLGLTLGSSSLTSMLDAMMAKGQVLKAVDVYAVDTSSGKPKVLTQDEFGLVAVNTDAIDPLTGEHSFSFQYSSVVQAVTSENSDGSLGATVKGGWDGVNNVATTQLVKTLTSTNGAVAIPAASTLQGYVEFRDASGNLIGGASGGWIPLANASYDLLQTLSPAGSGAGAGKLAFDPLSLTFAAGSLSPLLLQALAAGKTLTAEIATFQVAGTQRLPLHEDLMLGKVLLTSTSQDISSRYQTITLAYGQIEDTPHVQAANGAVSQGTTFAWDATRNTSLAGDIPGRQISNPATTSNQLKLATATSSGSKATAMISSIAVPQVIVGSAGGTITGGALPARLDGSAGDVTAQAGSTGDILIGAAGDTLYGGAGFDTFLFHAGFGKETLYNFTATGANHDALQFDSSIFADWAHLMGATNQQGSDLVITLDQSDMLLLKNVTMSSFTASDAKFV